MLVYLDLPRPFVSHHLVACFLHRCDIYVAVARQDILHGDRSDFAKDVCCYICVAPAHCAYASDKFIDFH